MDKQSQLRPIPGSMRFPTPEAHLEEWIGLAMSKGRRALPVIYHPNDDVRVSVLGHTATEVGADCLVAEPFSTNKQFLKAILQVRSLRDNGTVGDMMIRLVDSPKPLWIDHAHHLSPSMFGLIRSVFDQAGGPIIISSYEDSVIQKTDDRETGGKWFSRRMVYRWPL